MSSKPLSRIPLVIGITGHRDLDVAGCDLYRQQIADILHYFRKRFPHTPIWLLSALADGADRLAAEAALKLKAKPGMDITVIAPLPLERDDYRQDFDATSREAFDDLVSRMDHCFVLDSYHYGQADTSSREWRAAQYANLGAFIARHSNILIALWDGKDYAESAGGTSNVVNMMLNGEMDWGEGIPPRAEFAKRPLLYGGEHGAVLHIPVSRTHQDRNAVPNGLVDQGSENQKQWRKFKSLKKVHWYYTGLPSAAVDCYQHNIQHVLDYQRREFKEALAKIETFNCDAASLESAASGSYLKQFFSTVWLPPQEMESSAALTRNARNLFSHADALSRYFQARARKLVIAIFSSVLVAIGGYEIFGEYGEYDNLVADISLALLLGASVCIGILFAFMHLGRYKQKSQDYRALAEGLRVIFYLIHAGLNRGIGEIFSADSRNRTAWIDHARRCTELFTWEQGATRTDCLERIDEVRRWWVEDQKRYFEQKLGEDPVTLGESKTEGKLTGLVKRSKRLNHMSKLAYGLALAMLIAIMVSYLTGFVTIAQYIWIPGLFLAFTGVVAQWRELWHYDEDVGRYRMILDMYMRVEYELAYFMTTKSEQGASGVICELARQSLDENYKWYSTHSAREMGQ